MTDDRLVDRPRAGAALKAQRGRPSPTKQIKLKFCFIFNLLPIQADTCPVFMEAIASCNGMGFKYSRQWLIRPPDTRNMVIYFCRY
jgi:hypothetical protein